MAEIRRGEVWRLLTCILPHGDILHLLFNLYWLWAFGSLLEREYGHFKTAILMVVFALGSMSMEFAFLDGGIGLSGVGYGLFGLIWMLSRRDPRFADAIDQQTVYVFVGWFIFCIVMTMTHIMTIANLAHGAGLVLGVLLGLTITEPKWRVASATGFVAVMLLGLWGATFGRPMVNLSGHGGIEEGQWGYEALTSGRNAEAARWFRDAVKYQPDEAAYWYDLGIAYDRLGDKAAAQVAFQKAAQIEPEPASAAK
jgi:GlpG protein